MQLTIDQALEAAIREHKAGRLAVAEQIYRHILQLQPNHPRALHLLGMMAHQVGRNDDALQLMQRALELSPATPEFNQNLGSVLHAVGRFDEAIEKFHKAIELQPGVASAHNNLGNTLQVQGKLDEAIACFRTALALAPDYAEAHNNLGTTHQARDDLGEAQKSFRRALELNPNMSGAHANLANVMNLLGRVDESLEGHRRSIALEPQNGLYASNLLLTLNYHPDLSPAEIVAEHRAWAQRGPDKITASAPPHPRPARGEAQRRLRIGYISPDFRDHPVRDFFEPILRSYDRTNFEIFCYSDVVAPDTITARIKAMADHWRPIFGIDDLRTSQLIREDKIDILVELAVHTAGNRLLTLAHRPAPIQMSYLGYAATTGMTAVDYRITDGIVDPPDDHASRGPEKLLRLPRIFCCYDPPDVAPEVAPLPAATTNHITFGGLCTIAKVNRAVIELWSQVLHAVPQSRLLLRARGLQDPEVQADFATRFAAHGISRERLEMLPGTNFREYLATFNSVDIAFDPFPFNAHTTDCHALWMGVPFITLPGRTSVSRVGASLLSAVSLPQLIASSPQDYVRIAQTLSSDLPALAEMRATFRERLRNSPLLDAKSFTADLEAGYRQAWTEFCATT